MRLLAGSIVAGLLIFTACGGASQTAPPAPAGNAPAAQTPAAAAPSQAPDNVHFQTDFLVSGAYAGYWAAIDQGFYKKLNLNVTAVPSTGVNITIQGLANGSQDIGLLDGASLLEATSSGIPITCVASILTTSPAAIIVRADSPYHSIQDLRGKTIVTSAAGTMGQLMPAFLAYNHMTLKDITLKDVSPSAQVPALLNKQADAITGFVTTAQPQAELKGVQIRAFLYSDNGAPDPGQCLGTTVAYAKSHADILRRFILGTRQGFAWAVQNQDQAVAILHQHFPTQGTDIMGLQLKAVIPFLTQPVGGPYDLPPYQTAQRQLLQYGIIKNKVPLDKMLTNDYLPK